MRVRALAFPCLIRLSYDAQLAHQHLPNSRLPPPSLTPHTDTLTSKPPHFNPSKVEALQTSTPPLLLVLPLTLPSKTPPSCCCPSAFQESSSRFFSTADMADSEWIMRLCRLWSSLLDLGLLVATVESTVLSQLLVRAALKEQKIHNFFCCREGMRMRVPSFFGACNVAPLPQPCSHSACGSEKLLPGLYFSITENLQVVPKHLRKCCEAFNLQKEASKGYSPRRAEKFIFSKDAKRNRFEIDAQTKSDFELPIKRKQRKKKKDKKTEKKMKETKFLSKKARK